MKRFTQEMVPTALADGVWVGESVAYNGEQREVPVWHMVIAHRDTRGRLEHFSGILRDISDETGAREALRRSEEMLRELTDALPALQDVLEAHARMVR